MLFKKSINQKVGEGSMFDMSKIGMNISKLRKAANLTQMELADKLNISFQAVSNWERGQTMPDISKLTELSAIFGVSIDELLDNRRASELLDKINSDEDLPAVEKEEIEELAPILKPKQVDKMIANTGNIDINEIASVAPFISQEFLDEIAQNSFKESGNLNSIAPIAPFVSSALIDKLAMQLSDNGANLDAITCILPFVSQSAVDGFAKKRFAETGEMSCLAAAAPFLSQAYIDECAGKALSKTNDLSSIACMAPFISDTILNKLAMEALEKRGLSALSPIIPFIDSKIVEDYIKNHMIK